MKRMRQTPYMFFKTHAGFSYEPAKETQKQGQRRCAQRLATAERYANAHEWTYDWQWDENGCIGCSCGNLECSCSTGEPHETLVCLLRDSEGKVLASLGAICGATSEYRRVVEAELALEAMPSH